MKNLTPYFPELRARCAPMGGINRARTATHSLGGLALLFGRFFPGLLVPAKKGRGSRRRQFPRSDVFWAFLGQVLWRGASCRWALSRLQVQAVRRGYRAPPSSTSAYCQARRALALTWLQALFTALTQWFDGQTPGTWRGRTVRIIDGTGFSMPDTRANRGQWPYAGGQKPGCGFPTGKLVGLFCLHSGRLITFCTGAWKDHDLPLAGRLLDRLHPGEVLLADRAYCSWNFLALLQRRRIDFVIRLHQTRLHRSRLPSWWEAWKKPQRPAGQSRRAWARLPDELLLRMVRFRVQTRGFRPKVVWIVTSLLDQTAFPDAAIAELYAQRWQVETHYRQIKSALALDILRGLTPAIIERELWMHAIAYNLIRALMLEAAVTHAVPIERLSFKGVLDAAQSWMDLAGRRHPRHARHLLLARLAHDRVPLRPLRHEPRVRKRRPKSYSLLTRPRRLMRVARSKRLRPPYIPVALRSLS